MADEPEVVQDDNNNPDEGGEPKDDSPVEEPTLSVEELQKQLKELQEKSEVDKQGMTGQIIELRRKVQEAEALARGKEPDKPEPPKDDIEGKVYSILQKEKDEKKKENNLKALHNFWANHPEYHPENDLGGLRYETLKNALGRLNTAKSESVSDILRDYEDALILMSPKKKIELKKPDLSGAATTEVPGAPKVTETTPLSSEQEKLRKERGWTVKKYLEMKEKHPKIVL